MSRTALPPLPDLAIEPPSLQLYFSFGERLMLVTNVAECYAVLEQSLRRF